MNAAATTPRTSPISGERVELITTLDRQRGFLLQTAAGLTEEQARTRSTVSALTVASLLKHVADTEEQWFRFALDGADAFADAAGSEVDWNAIEADDSWSEVEWEDTRFVLSESDTLEHLRGRIEQVAARTDEILRTADLDAAHALPVAPWFAAGAEWSVRQVALHVVC